jgi:hypothetical protein
MKERTEDDVISKAPILVTLGETQYGLKPLPVLKAREWRSKLAQTMQGIVTPMSAEQSPNTIGPAMTAALVAFPDKVADLVFAWATDLPVDKVLNEASEEQIAVAYSAIMVMAYPFLMPLILTMKVTKSQLN